MAQKISNDILYYPHIEFHSAEWVKKSLMFWDHIFRIVPDGYSPQDSDEIKPFVDAGLIINVNLENEDKIEVTKRFTRLCKKMVSNNYRPAGLMGYDDEDEEEYEMVSKNKIDNRLYPYLDKIADTVNFSNNDWVIMNKSLARAYMFELSQVVAQRRCLNRGTDNDDVWSVGQYFSNKGYFNETLRNDDSKGYVCSLIVDDIIPAEIINVQSNKIINFVNERHDEKIALRGRIGTFIEELQKVRSQSHVSFLSDQFTADLKKEKDDLKKSMDFVKNGNIWEGIMTGVNMTAAGMQALGFVGAPFFSRNLCATLILGAVAGFCKYKGMKKKAEVSDVSFLVGVDDMCKKRINLICSNNIDEFVND